MASSGWTAIQVSAQGRNGLPVPDGQDLGPALVVALAGCATAGPDRRFVQITGEVSPGSRLTLTPAMLTLLAANRVSLRLVGRPGPAQGSDVVHTQ
ncbi:hypothetical protein [Hamadaea tsunoensis]|uniref:hypothetical protein n=1 Tax=Hamadaea tsunoensis TaxID=53368 RepID=UPI0004160089|nr:hypothetical protein [Hamadaea tsunoensis]